MRLLTILKLLKGIKKTPLFIYSRNKILKNISYCSNTRFKFFYALKANYNIEIIKLINIKGLGFEVVSIRELKLLVKLGVDTKKIIYSGVCKSNYDIRFIKSVNIGFINVDSINEIKMIYKVFRKSLEDIKLIVKLNLNIDVRTNKNIRTCTNSNKFGIYIDEIKNLIKFIGKNKIKIVGLGFHLGSQIKDYKPYILGIYKIISIAKKYKLKVKYINIGGGMAIDYTKRKKCYLKIIINKLKRKLRKINIMIIVEPGRSLLANSCFTLSRIVNIKKSNKKRFAIIDIGMESIIRLMLYKCKHNILSYNSSKKKIYDIVGPICESTDIICKDIRIGIKRNDIIIILDTGAYCMSMRMDYNMRDKPIEILV
ncbi:diaminopimelate decarboxylase [Candidatus Vidania fulgoroideorum]